VSHHVKVRPIRLKLYDERARCEKLCTVAYRAECSCGWRGRGMRTHGEARVDTVYHRKLNRL
jgi:hypothetical protein